MTIPTRGWQAVIAVLGAIAVFVMVHGLNREPVVRMGATFAELKRDLGQPERVSTARVYGFAGEWIEVRVTWPYGVEGLFDPDPTDREGRTIAESSRAKRVTISAPFSGRFEFGVDGRLKARLGERCDEIVRRMEEALEVYCTDPKGLASRITFAHPPNAAESGLDRVRFAPPPGEPVRREQPK